MSLKCKTRLASWPLWTYMEIHTDPALCVQNIALTPSRWSSASTTVATRIRAGFLLSTTSNFILGWKLWGGFCRERDVLSASGLSQGLQMLGNKHMHSPLWRLEQELVMCWSPPSISPRRRSSHQGILQHMEGLMKTWYFPELTGFYAVLSDHFGWTLWLVRVN